MKRSISALKFIPKYFLLFETTEETSSAYLEAVNERYVTHFITP